MDDQQFCLRWNNHQGNLVSVFDTLLTDNLLVDVTLACEGATLKAHKLVLSACSTFFQEIFVNNPCQHPVIVLKDMKFTEMKALLQFMYKGEVNVSQDQLSSLLRAAESLKIKGLAEGEQQDDKTTAPPPPPISRFTSSSQERQMNSFDQKMQINAVNSPTTKISSEPKRRRQRRRSNSPTSQMDVKVAKLMPDKAPENIIEASQYSPKDTFESASQSFPEPEIDAEPEIVHIKDDPDSPQANSQLVVPEYIDSTPIDDGDHESGDMSSQFQDQTSSDGMFHDQSDMSILSSIQYDDPSDPNLLQQQFIDAGPSSGGQGDKSNSEENMMYVDDNGVKRCSECQRSFSLPSNLKRHYISVHTNLRYKCNICKASYSQPNTLKLHVQRCHQIASNFNFG